VNDNARLHRIRLVLETLDLQEIQHFQLPVRSPIPLNLRIFLLFLGVIIIIIRIVWRLPVSLVYTLEFDMPVDGQTINARFLQAVTTKLLI
jgi:hypothetical protein